MDNVEYSKSWAYSFDRYRNAKYILDSESWKDAQDKINKSNNIDKIEKNDEFFYYDSNGTILWNEYKFLFLCQFLEFRTAELISSLQGKRKIKPEFILKCKKNKKADLDRAKKDTRIMSPASLISDLGYTLGNLIDILDNKTEDFNNKVKILEKLNKFNSYRVSFIHHSFNTNKKIGDINLREIVFKGNDLGKEILKLF